MSKRGRKSVCSIVGCQEKQDGYSKCVKCANHSRLCMCDYHFKKRNRVRKRDSKLLYENKTNRAPQTKLKRQQLSAHCSIESQVITYDEFDSLDDNPLMDSVNEDYETLCSMLALDERNYLDLLLGSSVLTSVNANVLCYPDLEIDKHGNTKLASAFTHAYKVHRTYGPYEKKREVVITDCDCTYTDKLALIIAGGFDTKEMTFKELMLFFEAGEPCMHSR